ncbi:MAG: hypothetical protein M5U07_27640 [Xanthobacteraceae bacterium]|nr:hypothetical protein [Xanthobacteraceae bacterium]
MRHILLGLALLAAGATGAAAQTLTVDEFRRDLVGVPLCGTPTLGPLAGKPLCTVHMPDGTAILAGSGILVRGIWETASGRICRRNAHDPIDRRRCVDYERVSPHVYRNSDGIEFCLGPCPTEPPEAPTAAAAPQAATPPASPPAR